MHARLPPPEYAGWCYVLMHKLAPPAFPAAASAAAASSSAAAASAASSSQPVQPSAVPGTDPSAVPSADDLFEREYVCGFHSPLEAALARRLALQEQARCTSPLELA